MTASNPAGNLSRVKKRIDEEDNTPDRNLWHTIRKIIYAWTGWKWV